jgi:hypothetical protein
VILRWLAIGSLFLVINAIAIIWLADDNRMVNSTQTGLPQDVLNLINQKQTL